MQRKTRLWLVVGLVVFALAACFCWFAIDRARTPSSPQIADQEAARPEPIEELGPHNYAHDAPLPVVNTNTAAPASASAKKLSHNIPLLTNRLSNTAKPLRELIYSDSAILL